ncbi:MAG: hypothetical protein OSJ70_07190 [Bacilli bacterium]|nr:hypothetical protein [Bacilli bacterium]
MIITKDMLNKKVPKEMLPSSFDSATDLYTNTKDGLILYNIKPDTWNILYPFFQQENKFMINPYKIENPDITYRELIDLYEDIYNREYVSKRGFNEDKRKRVLVEEFNKVFNVNGTKIGEKLDSHYELKYSKSKNVYTLYYLESYIASDIEDVNKLLGQKVYSQELLNLNDDSIMKEINGIKVVDSLSLLDDADKLRIVRKNILD